MHLVIDAGFLSHAISKKSLIICSHQLSLTCEKRRLKSFFCAMCRYFSCFYGSVDTDKSGLFLHPLDAENLHTFFSIHFIKASLDPLSLKPLRFSFGNARGIPYVFLHLFFSTQLYVLYLSFSPPPKDRKKSKSKQTNKKKKKIRMTKCTKIKENAKTNKQKTMFVWGPAALGRGANPLLCLIFQVMFQWKLVFPFLASINWE